VEPSDYPPVRYRGRVWIRIGPRRDIATPQEERQLTEKRRARDIPFDIRPLPEAPLDDLDQVLFADAYLPSAVALDALDSNRRSVAEQLASLRFTTPDDPPYPTVLGVLTIGEDPRRYIPGAYVQFLRIDGEQLTDPIIDQADISNALPYLLRLLDEKLQAHVKVATDVTSQEVEVCRPDYPIVALQQLARNAVLHRTYEGTNAPVRITWFNDRIEILSPGGAFGQVTRENFGQPNITDYRNPNLAEVMKNLGYVQRFGMGIQLARDALAQNESPQPEFTVEATHVLATIRSR